MFDSSLPRNHGNSPTGTKRESLVVRLEDLPAFVEEVAPGGVVAGHARVQHEVVSPTGDRERIELDRTEPTEDLEHGLRSSRERTRRREHLARDEEATCGLGRDLHGVQRYPARLVAYAPRVLLYNSAVSGNCYKVRLLLAQLGLEYETLEVLRRRPLEPRGAPRRAEPGLRVPTLVLDDGRPLAESNAILWYFGDGTQYVPEDAYERAQVLQWQFFEQYSHEPNIAVARFW